MSLEYKPSLGFVETAGLVIAIQVADAMAKAAEVEIISAHKVDGLRVCVICKGDVAACQAAVETGALLAQSLNGLNGYNIIPSPAELRNGPSARRKPLPDRPQGRQAGPYGRGQRRSCCSRRRRVPQGQGQEVVVSRNGGVPTGTGKRCRPAQDTPHAT